MDVKSQSSDSTEHETVIATAKQQVERLYHYTSYSTRTCLDYMPVVILCLLPGQPFGWIAACFLIKSMRFQSKTEADIKEQYKRRAASFFAVSIVMSVAIVMGIIGIAVVGVI
ncbi:uncharacterized protein [Dysidea avara]|uniref:uncharacterized protein n=1 Tax=Dysidea avara TaxID=196820 RepID=UPI0033174424